MQVIDQGNKTWCFHDAWPKLEENTNYIIKNGTQNTKYHQEAPDNNLLTPQDAGQKEERGNNHILLAGNRCPQITVCWTSTTKSWQEITRRCRKSKVGRKQNRDIYSTFPHTLAGAWDSRTEDPVARSWIIVDRKWLILMQQWSHNHY